MRGAIVVIGTLLVLCVVLYFTNNHYIDAGIAIGFSFLIGVVYGRLMPWELGI